MRCRVSQELLLNSILEAQRFVANKGFASILLSGIYLEVISETKLVIRSSTGAVLYQTEVDCQKGEVGSGVIPASILSSSLRTLSSGLVDLEIKDEQLTISQGSTKFQITTLTGEDFPLLSFSPDQKNKPFLLPGKNFASAAHQSLIAASADETKPVLTAVLLEMKQPNSLVTTDGFRLFRVVTDISLDQDGSLLIPAKALRELLGILEKRSLEILECYLDSVQQKMIFNLGNGWLEVNTIIGDYPDYRTIIPEVCSFSLQIEREALILAVKQAMIFAKEFSGIVILEVDNQELLVSSQSSNSGRTKSRLPLLKNEGEPVRFAVNGKYLLDFLGTVDSLEVQIQGNEPLRPIIFRIPEDERLLYLIMPFKLQE